MMAVYMAAAIVLHRSEDVKRVDCDMASVHGLLSGIPLDSPPFELLLQRSANLYEHFPPEDMEPEVKERMRLIQEAAMPPRRVHNSNQAILKKKAIDDSRSKYLVKGFVLVTTPVLIGVLIYRFVNNQYF